MKLLAELQQGVVFMSRVATELQKLGVFQSHISTIFSLRRRAIPYESSE